MAGYITDFALIETSHWVAFWPPTTFTVTRSNVMFNGGQLYTILKESNRNYLTG